MSVLEFRPRPSVRAQLVASIDVLDLGQAMWNSGNAMIKAGIDVARTFNPPSETTLCEVEAMASVMLQAAQAFRLHAALHAGHVQLPADCEPVA